ncbi:hypothetical protein FOZ63_025882 [Perkinsus olseni]|uniref:Uncharacterized protein n=1 Tax=Perkinsus olseni TaxID=32597 RepID=A0A7J6P2N5_PEROL|nr:hypothetical protein FOZ63_025882 [Perkinsus olseni]
MLETLCKACVEQTSPDDGQVTGADRQALFDDLWLTLADGVTATMTETPLSSLDAAIVLKCFAYCGRVPPRPLLVKLLRRVAGRGTQGFSGYGPVYAMQAVGKLSTIDEEIAGVVGSILALGRRSLSTMEVGVLSQTFAAASVLMGRDSLPQSLKIGQFLAAVCKELEGRCGCKSGLGMASAEVMGLLHSIGKLRWGSHVGNLLVALEPWVGKILYSLDLPDLVAVAHAYTRGGQVGEAGRVTINLLCACARELRRIPVEAWDAKCLTLCVNSYAMGRVAHERLLSRVVEEVIPPLVGGLSGMQIALVAHGLTRLKQPVPPSVWLRAQNVVEGLEDWQQITLILQSYGKNQATVMDPEALGAALGRRIRTLMASRRPAAETLPVLVYALWKSDVPVDAECWGAVGQACADVFSDEKSVRWKLSEVANMLSALTSVADPNTSPWIHDFAGGVINMLWGHPSSVTADDLVKIGAACGKLGRTDALVVLEKAVRVCAVSVAELGYIHKGRLAGALVSLGCSSQDVLQLLSEGTSAPRRVWAKGLGNGAGIRDIQRTLLCIFDYYSTPSSQPGGKLLRASKLRRMCLDSGIIDEEGHKGLTDVRVDLIYTRIHSSGDQTAQGLSKHQFMDAVVTLAEEKYHTGNPAVSLARLYSEHLSSFNSEASVEDPAIANGQQGSEGPGHEVLSEQKRYTDEEVARVFDACRRPLMRLYSGYFPMELHGEDPERDKSAAATHALHGYSQKQLCQIFIDRLSARQSLP